MESTMIVAAGMGAGAVGKGAEYFKWIIASIREYMGEYTTAEKAARNALVQFFLATCYENEKEDKILTTIKFDWPKNDNVTEEMTQLPYVYLMDEKNQYPLAYHLKSGINYDIESWKKLLSVQNHLTANIINMLSIINIYQVKINQKFYSPLNLLLEDFKAWLIKLSRATISQKTVDIVKGRRDFIAKVIANRIFKSESWLELFKTFNSEELIELLGRIIAMLDKHIIPFFEERYKKEGAREDFDKLTGTLKNLIADELKFVSHFVRDKEVVAGYTTDCLQGSGEKLDEYIKGTRVGGLIAKVVNHEIFNTIFPPLTEENNSLVVIPAKKLSNSLNLNEMGEKSLRKPLIEGLKYQPIPGDGHCLFHACFDYRIRV